MDNDTITTENEKQVSLREIDNYLRAQNVSNKLRVGVTRVIARMGVSNFLNGSPLAWDNAYKAGRPGTHYGLGRLYIATMHNIVTWAKTENYKKTQAIVAKAEEAEIKAKCEAEAKHQAELQESKMNPVFTQKQIRALADFMEYCDITEVNLKTVGEFFLAFKVKPMGEYAPKESKESNHVE